MRPGACFFKENMQGLPRVAGFHRHGGRSRLGYPLQGPPMPPFLVPALVLILGCHLAGEVIARGLGLPLPGPVLGLVFLLGLITLSARLRDAVRPVAQGILAHLSLLFVPAGVGVVAHLGLFAEQGAVLALALVVSTVAAIVVGALTFTLVARWTGNRDE